MTKKYILAGAIAAFLAAANIVHAPTIIRQIFSPPQSIIRINRENLLEKYAKEDEEKKEKLMSNLDDIKNYRTNSFHEDSDELLLARMIFGEAEDCSRIEKIAVAYTAINRAKQHKETLKKIILKPYQYSCFNPELKSSIFLKDPLKHNRKEFLASLKLAKEILAGKYKDPTYGATFYFNPSKVRKPSWTKNLKKIGRVGNSYHVFYKER